MPAILPVTGLALRIVIKSMKKVIFILPVLLIVVLSCMASTNEKQITLGKNNFCIPAKFSLLDQTSSSLLNIKGADTGGSGGSFQVAIDPPEVKQSIPEYSLNHGNLPAVLFVNIRQADAQTLKNVNNGNTYAEVLQLSKTFENAQVEYDENTHFYRVSDNAVRPFIWWEVLKMEPNKMASVPKNVDDYHIASCSMAGGNNGNSSTCDYSFVADGYLVKIITTENNLLLKEKITAYSKKLLELWRHNCK